MRQPHHHGSLPPRKVGDLRAAEPRRQSEIQIELSFPPAEATLRRALSRLRVTRAPLLPERFLKEINFAPESSYALSRTAPRKSGPCGAAWSGGCGDGG